MQCISCREIWWCTTEYHATFSAIRALVTYHFCGSWINHDLLSCLLLISRSYFKRSSVIFLFIYFLNSYSLTYSPILSLKHSFTYYCKHKGHRDFSCINHHSLQKDDEREVQTSRTADNTAHARTWCIIHTLIMQPEDRCRRRRGCSHLEHYQSAHGHIGLGRWPSSAEQIHSKYIYISVTA